MDLENIAEIKASSDYGTPIILVYMQYFQRSENYDKLIKKIDNIIKKTLDLSNKKYNLDKFSVSIDLLNTSIIQVDYTLAQSLIKKFYNDYPKKLHKLEIINMNIVLKGVYKIIEPFLRESTKNRIILKDKEITISSDSDEN
tara:strand:- start:530 stop:955 length:426 start_codon:yes stop_codon:yes gene_type:complete